MTDIEAEEKLLGEKITDLLMGIPNILDDAAPTGLMSAITSLSAAMATSPNLLLRRKITSTLVKTSA